MSTNKHALIRYRVIDKCLRQIDRQWNWQNLAKACAIEIEKVTGKTTTLSERTIKGDIQSMRHDDVLGYHAPIEYDRAEKSYYYSNRNFSITEAPLSRSDSNELKQAIGLLRQFTGFRHLEGIENIIQKLELLAYESTAREKKLVHIEQAPVIPGQKWLDPLYEAIKKENAVSIQYKPFAREAQSVILSPYLLKEYDNRWYLYAHDHDRSGLRTYGLERILAVRESLQSFVHNIDFDPDTYFNDIIGVTLNKKQKKQKVRFEVYGASIPYVRTKSFHESQVELNSDRKKAVFEIEVIPNFELESLFLSFGEAVKIIQPASLRNRLAKRVHELAGLYGI